MKTSWAHKNHEVSQPSQHTQSEVQPTYGGHYLGHATLAMCSLEPHDLELSESAPTSNTFFTSAMIINHSYSICPDLITHMTQIYPRRATSPRTSLAHARKSL